MASIAQVAKQYWRKKADIGRRRGVMFVEAYCLPYSGGPPCGFSTSSAHSTIRSIAGASGNKAEWRSIAASIAGWIRYAHSILVMICATIIKKSVWAGLPYWAPIAFERSHISAHKSDSASGASGRASSHSLTVAASKTSRPIPILLGSSHRRDWPSRSASRVRMTSARPRGIALSRAPSARSSSERVLAACAKLSRPRLASKV